MNNKKILIIALVVIIAVIAIQYGKSLIIKNSDQDSAGKNQGEVVLSESGDLIIPVDDISGEAIFYPVDVEGTTIEVLAIKAEDGSIRTAFNTCQVCYDSGRGYYEQVGDKLVCQNCGNSFRASDVEVTKGGCNPVPIASEDKIVDSESITISKEYLVLAKEIFANWKAE